MEDKKDTRVRGALQCADIGQDTQNSPSQMRNETGSQTSSPVTTQSSKYKEETATEIGAAVPIRTANNREETAAEIAAPVPVARNRGQNNNQNAQGQATGQATGARGLGAVALALSILSLFVLPILFGAAGIVLGFIARRRGATSLGAWAIGIGAISIIIGIFILPFF